MAVLVESDALSRGKSSFFASKSRLYLQRYARPPPGLSCSALGSLDFPLNLEGDLALFEGAHRLPRVAPATALRAEVTRESLRTFSTLKCRPRLGEPRARLVRRIRKNPLYAPTRLPPRELNSKRAGRARTGCLASERCSEAPISMLNVSQAARAAQRRRPSSIGPRAQRAQRGGRRRLCVEVKKRQQRRAS